MKTLTQQRYSNPLSRDLNKYFNSKFKLNVITRFRSQSLFNSSISALLNSDHILKLKTEIISLNSSGLNLVNSKHSNEKHTCP